MDKIQFEDNNEGVSGEQGVIDASQYTDCKFVGRLEKIKAFHAGMRAISFAESARFQINENGFRIVVENASSIQASLFITKEVFEEFELKEDIYFNINMKIFLDIVNLFAGVDCSVKIFYKGEGSPIIFIMEYTDEPDVTTECKIKTARYEESNEFALNEDSPSYNVIFIRGPDMSQIFSEIDRTAEDLEITLSPDEPYFRLATMGVMQSEWNTEVAKSSDMMLMFNCRDTTVGRYKCTHMRLTSKALSSSSKVAIKTDSSGLMEMHFMIYSNDEAQVYIQFFILPLVDDD